MKKLILVFLIVILDQLSKFIFTNKSFGIINYTINKGIVFGLFKGYNLLFIIISIIFILFVSYLFLKENNIEYGLILGGAVGNLIDRILFGFVRDFIDLKIWPVFNLADSFIVIGILLVIWKEIYKKSG